MPMYETGFSLHDLFRRKAQTSLIVICLTLTVASTLFLLLYGSRMGIGFTTVNENVLTLGLSLVFAQFIRFLTFLILVVGAILVSFTTLLMMTQRTRDLGLIKAAGCPNDLLYGYFVSEVIIISFLGCTLGVIIGLGTDYALTILSGFTVYQTVPNFWFAPVVFVFFFILALIFGAKPIGDTVKLPPLTALSTAQYYGLASKAKAKPFTKSNLTAKVALRSLFRRKTTTLRMVLLLCIVFVLLTVSIAGIIIAQQTTLSWIKEASGQDTIALAHKAMVPQYLSLLSSFTGSAVNESFNYANPELAVPDNITQRLQAVPGIDKIDERLILKEHLLEWANFTINPETGVTTSVGDKREGDFLVIGVEPENLTTSWQTQGRFIREAEEVNVVVGDWLAQRFFGQALVESIQMGGKQFGVVGVCIDPIENGKVVYVPSKQLQDLTTVASANFVLIELNPSVDRNKTLSLINGIVDTANSELVTFSLYETVQNNAAFLVSTWSTVMILPVFTLSSAAICLVAYVMLSVEEQSQEFGFLRALGAKPKTVTGIVAIQSSITLLSSMGMGISIGTITTLLILMQHPLVTNFTIIEIGVWLAAALLVMLVLSLVPALRLAKKPLIKLIS
jgi:ABC-type antimicrobial peptide transport system permease subunit